MRKHTILLAILVLGLTLLAQEIQHEAVAVNIEVPVRVYKGNDFVDNLTINDFEIYEDGILQETDAVYLIKKANIERVERPKAEESQSQPEVSRNFVLVFEIKDYLPKVGEAIDHFFKEVIKPEDTLLIITPMKDYNIKTQALKNLSMEDIAKQVKSKIKKDVRLGSADYHRLVREIKNVLMGEREAGDVSLEERLQWVYDLYSRWKSQRYVEEKNLISFANYLKLTDKQKHIFVFYQKLVLPKLNAAKMVMTTWSQQGNPFVLAMVQDLFGFYNFNISMDLDRVKEAFSDSSITSHFLYITKTQTYELDVNSTKSPLKEGVAIVEEETDISAIFKEMAQATGGLVDSSLNAAAAFKRAVAVSENYYLLYYTPKNYLSDGKFKKIKVKIKGKNYRITHRAGYIAD